MAITNLGRRRWSMESDDDGHSEYTIQWLIETTDPLDGPTSIWLSGAIAAVGSTWGYGNDIDLQAWCRPRMSFRMVVEDEPNTLWIVEQYFSSKPILRCQDASPGDPLAEPPKWGGTFGRFMRQTTIDKDDNVITNSSLQRVPIEVPDIQPTITVTQNVATLNLTGRATVLRAPLNDAPLWGLPARCIMFSKYTWEQNFYGLCYTYFTETLEFEANADTFDTEFIDEGSRVLNGHWDDTGAWVLDDINGGAPSANNPNHFIRYVDRNGFPGTTLLDGAGKPLTDAGSPVVRTARPMKESNLLLLGIPATLGS
jgi:hypothetical protein